MKYFNIELKTIVGMEESLEVASMNEKDREEWFQETRHTLRQRTKYNIEGKYDYKVESIENDSIYVPDNHEFHFLPIYKGTLTIKEGE